MPRMLAENLPNKYIIVCLTTHKEEILCRGTILKEFTLLSSHTHIHVNHAHFLLRWFGLSPSVELEGWQSSSVFSNTLVRWAEDSIIPFVVLKV